jgi:hypothetical protein
MILRRVAARVADVHGSREHVRPVRIAVAVGRRLNLLRRPEPGLHQGHAGAGVAREPLTFLLIIVGNGGITHQQVQPVECRAPAVEHVAAAIDDIVLQRPTGGDGHPLQVLLPPMVGGHVGRGPDLREMKPVGAAARRQLPPVRPRVPGVEDEIDIIDVIVVVAQPVGFPGRLVSPIEAALPAFGGELVDEALGVGLAPAEPAPAADPRGAEGAAADRFQQGVDELGGQLRLDEDLAVGAAGQHLLRLDPAVGQRAAADGQVGRQRPAGLDRAPQVGDEVAGLAALRLPRLGVSHRAHVGGRDQADASRNPLPAVVHLRFHRIDREHDVLRDEGRRGVVAEPGRTQPQLVRWLHAGSFHRRFHAHQRAFVDKLCLAPGARQADHLAALADRGGELAAATEQGQGLLLDARRIGHVDLDLPAVDRLCAAGGALAVLLPDDLRVADRLAVEAEAAVQLGNEVRAFHRGLADVGYGALVGGLHRFGAPHAAKVAGPHAPTAAVHVDHDVRPAHFRARAAAGGDGVVRAEDVAGDAVDVDVGGSASEGAENRQAVHRFPPGALGSR